jgi:hypothetical protein
VPDERVTIEWTPYGWNILESNGLLIANVRTQEQAWQKAEALLEKRSPKSETFISCSNCPYLKNHVL